MPSPSVWLSLSLSLSLSPGCQCLFSMCSLSFFLLSWWRLQNRSKWKKSSELLDTHRCCQAGWQSCENTKFLQLLDLKREVFLLSFVGDSKVRLCNVTILIFNLSFSQLPWLWVWEWCAFSCWPCSFLLQNPIETGMVSWDPGTCWVAKLEMFWDVLMLAFPPQAFFSAMSLTSHCHPPVSMPMLAAWTVAVASVLLHSASFGSSLDQSLPPMCPSLLLEAAGFSWFFLVPPKKRCKDLSGV